MGGDLRGYAFFNQLCACRVILYCFQKTLKYIRPRGYKTFFMVNSTENEISTAHKN